MRKLFILAFISLSISGCLPEVVQQTDSTYYSYINSTKYESEIPPNTLERITPKSIFELLPLSVPQVLELVNEQIKLQFPGFNYKIESVEIININDRHLYYVARLKGISSFDSAQIIVLSNGELIELRKS